MERPRPRPPPASSDALISTLSNAVQALGRGFDVTSDTRLLYSKGVPGCPLVLVDAERTRDVVISDDGGVVLADISLDIDILMERSLRETTRVCSFQEVSQINPISLSLGFFPLLFCDLGLSGLLKLGNRMCVLSWTRC